MVWSMDYFATFHVAKLNSVRVIFSVAVNLDWPFYPVNVKNAFLCGDFREEVHVELPPIIPLKDHTVMVCLLKKPSMG